MNNQTELIRLIRKAFKEELPGVAAHDELTPEIRKLSIPEENIDLHASVLILIYQNGKQFETVFMKRPDYDGAHSGQISFPGGKYDSKDANYLDTAIRESHEEIGIDPEKTEVLGKLTDLFIPVSNFLVHPYVAFYHGGPNFKIDKTEVAYLLKAPLQEACQWDIKLTKMNYNGEPFDVPYFSLEGEVLWGATSMIFNEFKTIMQRIIHKL